MASKRKRIEPAAPDLPKIRLPAAPAALSMLDRSKIEYAEDLVRGGYRVAGKFSFWPTTGTGLWREDGGGQGYGAASLIAAIVGMRAVEQALAAEKVPA